MEKLSYQNLQSLPADVRKPAYDLNATGVGIVHLGPGAFHRAHQAVYTDLAMQFGGDWRITAVSLRSRGVRNELAQQDFLYTLSVIDEQPYNQIVGAFKKVLVLSEERDEVMADLCAETTHIVTMTITEKGYCLNSQGHLDLNNPDIVLDIANPDSPVSAIGLLVAALKQRKADNLTQITIISCDNLSDNGDKLKTAVLDFANHQDPELAKWIKANICFPNTMVDSITPATEDTLVEQVSAQIGVHDGWPIQRESFTQWVIEDKFSGPRPAWHNVGVTFTDDVALYEKAKLRVLNGTHSTLAYLGCLVGITTVYEAISDSSISGFIERLLKQEILPSIGEPAEMDLNEYANAILQRYRNSHIRHLLAQIAWDGSQKLPFRVLNTIRDNLAAQRDIKLLCVPIAAWILFLKEKEASNGEVVDPLAQPLMELAASAKGDLSLLADKLFSVESVFAELADNTQFTDTVKQQIKALEGINADNLAQVLGAL